MEDERRRVITFEKPGEGEPAPRPDALEQQTDDCPEEHRDQDGRVVRAPEVCLRMVTRVSGRVRRVLRCKVRMLRRAAGLVENTQKPVAEQDRPHEQERQDILRRQPKDQAGVSPRCPGKFRGSPMRLRSSQLLR